MVIFKTINRQIYFIYCFVILYIIDKIYAYTITKSKKPLFYINKVFA